jgi:hypothetical protein
MLVKDAVQLWPETARETLRLPDDQVTRLKQLADDLQKELHEKLVAMPSNKQTGSYADKFEEGAADESDAEG